MGTVHTPSCGVPGACIVGIPLKQPCLGDFANASPHLVIVLFFTLVPCSKVTTCFGSTNNMSTGIRKAEVLRIPVWKRK